MEIILSKMFTADGNLYEGVQAEVPDDFLKDYAKLTTDGYTFYMAPEFIISFEIEEKPKPRIMQFKK